MRKVLLSLLLVGLMVVPASAQCEPGVCGPEGCPTRVDVSVRDRVRVKVRVPTPAWRYAWAVGHRAAVVRIYCQDGARTRSIGSGVLVRWGRRIVVLTARHVLKDARRVRILLQGKLYRARVLKVDRHWDCAVLNVESLPAGIEPAEMAFGEDAKFRKGDRLESCGYGPDGKLAANSGLFIGYRRSTRTTGGPDDWMVLSGYARGGDSGGPIFNKKGLVVGVLWGTDGETVVGVQAGRLHLLLSRAVAVVVEQKMFIQLAAFQRRPTPPMPGPEPYIEPAGPLVPVQPATEQAKFGNRDPWLKWRRDAEARDKALMDRLDRQADLWDKQLATPSQGPSVDVQVNPPALTPKPPKTIPEPTPFGIGLCLALAGVCGIVLFYVVGKN